MYDNLCYADIVARLTLNGYVVRTYRTADLLTIEVFSQGATVLQDDGLDAEFYVSPGTMICDWGKFWDADDNEREGEAHYVLAMLGAA